MGALFEKLKRAVEAEQDRPLEPDEEVELKALCYFSKGVKLKAQLETEPERLGDICKRVLEDIHGRMERNRAEQLVEYEKLQSDEEKANTNLKTFSELRAEYYVGTKELMYMRQRQDQRYSYVTDVKARLLNALGENLSILPQDPKTLENDLLTVPRDLLSEALRFPKDYREGKPAPRDRQEHENDDIPF